MPALPTELLEHVFMRLRDAGTIVNAMCANSKFRDIGERVLYRELTLNMRIMDTVATRRRDVRCFVSLSTSQSTPRALRHLTINGHAADDFRTILTTLLSRANNLLSLSLNLTFHESSQSVNSDTAIPSLLCTSRHFLPRLTALDASDPQLVRALALGRSLSSVRIRSNLSYSDVEALAITGLCNPAGVAELQLQCAVDGLDACVAFLTFIAQHFHDLCVLSTHFVLPSGYIPTWEEFEDTTRRFFPLLHSLRHLHVYNFTTTPDPVMARTPDSNYDTRTHELALQVMDAVPGLRRVELRWHGWQQRGSGWIPVPQTKLMRRKWYYADQRQEHASE